VEWLSISHLTSQLSDLLPETIITYLSLSDKKHTTLEVCLSKVASFSHSLILSISYYRTLHLRNMIAAIDHDGALEFDDDLAVLIQAAGLEADDAHVWA
jgi:hypothetical protein